MIYSDRYFWPHREAVVGWQCTLRARSICRHFTVNSFCCEPKQIFQQSGQQYQPNQQRAFSTPDLADRYSRCGAGRLPHLFLDLARAVGLVPRCPELANRALAGFRPIGSFGQHRRGAFDRRSQRQLPRFPLRNPVYRPLRSIRVAGWLHFEPAAQPMVVVVFSRSNGWGNRWLQVHPPWIRRIVGRRSARDYCRNHLPLMVLIAPISQDRTTFADLI